MTMRLYLDSVAVIYLVQQVAPFVAPLNRRVAVPGTVLVTSHLTRMECRIGPLRSNDLARLRDFDDYLANAIAEMVPLSLPVLDRASEIRARYPNIKTPDAIHLAAAVESACDVFLTNDHRLSRFPDITVETV